ncbi:hypothetical protein TPHA_0G01470 [Tetrapisispora phaffii CBS 4417]|uniref:Uncharacterized protein n=1 Tax=Tetrapisispora phaffii (strain ATCC 24235 / CBS 4417 / NBRC 1672 / NRRL Y-8282 / UCD 70-5) TaxID=1071381 RepID=G8BVQ6_TETPH|nr:hypothetical protein TPHA_0G01470 [Tetrapisispora phaffii CBS 4417]CCE63984.1 hypothetical protein TPHA_0G01470 [Tetrapisispora phaffii CBS 4417]
MRVPPPPRRSRSRKVLFYVRKVKRICFYRFSKKKSNERKLKSTKTWSKYLKHKFVNVRTPLTSVRIEDMVNLPSATQVRSAKSKPLLITTFYDGCENRPDVTMLQRTRLSRLHLSKRKFRLSHFDNLETYLNNDNKLKQKMNHECANSVRIIKNIYMKNADVKVVYHGKNIIQRKNLLFQHSTDLQKKTLNNTIQVTNPNSPEFVDFGNDISVRLHDYSVIDKENIISRKLFDKGKGKRNKYLYNINGKKEHINNPEIKKLFIKSPALHITYSPKVVNTQTSEIVVISHFR